MKHESRRASSYEIRGGASDDVTSIVRITIHRNVYSKNIRICKYLPLYIISPIAQCSDRALPS